MEDTENFHKTCAPVYVLAKEIHFAVAIGVTQFIRLVRVFNLNYKQLKKSISQLALVMNQYLNFFQRELKYSQLLHSEPEPRMIIFPSIQQYGLFGPKTNLTYTVEPLDNGYPRDRAKWAL